MMTKGICMKTGVSLSPEGSLSCCSFSPETLSSPFVANYRPYDPGAGVLGRQTGSHLPPFSFLFGFAAPVCPAVSPRSPANCFPLSSCCLQVTPVGIHKWACQPLSVDQLAKNQQKSCWCLLLKSQAGAVMKWKRLSPGILEVQFWPYLWKLWDFWEISLLLWYSFFFLC